MNKIILVGRLTRDPKLETTSSGVEYCKFNVACNSKNKTENGEKKADFFTCVGWKEKGKLVAKYCKKGSLINISGTMSSRSYNGEDGVKKTVWEVVVEDIEFLSGKEEIKMEEVDDGDCPF